MRNSNIVRLDSKGRILIPSHIRKHLNIEDGVEVIIMPDNDSTQARILPLLKEKTAEFRIVMNDVPGSLAFIAENLANFDVDILMSQSRTLSKGRTAAWDLIVDTSTCNGNLETLRETLLKSDAVKSLEIVRM